MDIDRLNPIPGPRPAAGDIGDLLGRLRAAGSVEAEVIRVLRDQLVLRSALGEILARNRLDLRPGDRVRIRLAGSATEPVLRVRAAPQPPVTIAAAEVPRLARALPPDRPALAEILRASPRATEIRLAGQTHTLPLRIETAGRSLVSLERRPAAPAIEIRPLARAPIYRALLRHLLPHHTPADADSLVRLLERVRPPAPGSTQPAQQPATGRESATRAPAPTAATAATPLAATSVMRPPPTPAIDPPGRPAMGDATTPPASPRRAPAPLDTVRGDRRSAVATGIPRTPEDRAARPAPGTPAPRNTPADQSAETPPARAARDSIAAARPASSGVLRPGTDSGPSPANRARGPVRGPEIAPEMPSAATPAPLARLLEWLPRSAELDASRLRHWIELLGFARPAAAAGARMPDLVDWLRQLQAFDAPTREPAGTAGRRAAPAGAGEAQTSPADAREASSALPRESFRLAEQAVTHNLLQRAAAGLQQETQQPLNLSLTLPFVDAGEVRPLRLELEQRGGRGEGGGEPAWDIRVSFEFGALGPITCHLVLAGRALAASFYCELAATRERVAAALPDLRRRLDAAGFDPGELHSFAGRPRARQPAAAFAAEFLIDLEA